MLSKYLTFIAIVCYFLVAAIYCRHSLPVYIDPNDSLPVVLNDVTRVSQKPYYLRRISKIKNDSNNAHKRKRVLLQQPRKD